MAKLLQLSRPSRRVSNVVRTWWAMRSQKRRRNRADGAPVVPAVPSAPTNMAAVGNGGVLIAVSWSDPAADMQGFRVYRSVDEGDYVPWQTLNPGNTYVEDTDFDVGHLYSYYVVAFNDAGESAPSNVAQIVGGS
jgi:hypothetical protein